MQKGERLPLFEGDEDFAAIERCVEYALDHHASATGTSSARTKQSLQFESILGGDGIASDESLAREILG